MLVRSGLLFDELLLSFSKKHEEELTRLQHDVDVLREQKDMALKRVSRHLDVNLELFLCQSHHRCRNYRLCALGA